MNKKLKTLGSGITRIIKTDFSKMTVDLEDDEKSRVNFFRENLIFASKRTKANA